jgi:hypothetical protein
MAIETIGGGVPMGAQSSVGINGIDRKKVMASCLFSIKLSTKR